MYSGLATMSLEQEVVDNPSLEGVTEDDLTTLSEWIAKLESKYPIVGFVTDGPFAAEAKAYAETRSGSASGDALFVAGEVQFPLRFANPVLRRWLMSTI